VNVTPFDAPAVVVTTTGPVVAPPGTVQVRDDTPQVPHVADVPLNVTVELPCEAPKLLPAIVTEVEVGPAFGVKLVITGREIVVTVNVTPFDAPTEVVTTTLPVVAPPGTVQIRELTPHVPQVAAVPLKVTVELP